MQTRAPSFACVADKLFPCDSHQVHKQVLLDQSLLDPGYAGTPACRHIHLVLKKHTPGFRASHKAMTLIDFSRLSIHVTGMLCFCTAMLYSPRAARYISCGKQCLKCSKLVGTCSSLRSPAADEVDSVRVDLLSQRKLTQLPTGDASMMPEATQRSRGCQFERGTVQPTPLTSLFNRLADKKLASLAGACNCSKGSAAWDNPRFPGSLQSWEYYRVHVVVC